jgi:glycerophosphoryl diester phosphodiesterase
MKPWWFTAALLAAASTACSAPNPATGTSGSGGSAGGSGAGGAAPVIDPSLFDCTAKKDPARVNPTPIACATDAACATRLVGGHRGAGGQLGVIAPEDSVAAVRAAIVLGLDFVETDPRPTKDGFLVNLHDTDVDRTTFGTGPADMMTLAEIQGLKLRTDTTPGDFSCERVPTLEEILTAARGKVHVLVDANKTDRVDLLVAAIQKTNTLDWAIFDTSSVAKIDAALALEPLLHTMIRVTTTSDLDAELAHFAAHPPVIVEVESGADPQALIPAIHAAKNRAQTDVFVIDLGAGLAHDPSQYAPTFAEGIDIVETDRPDLVLQFLGRWPPPAQP